MSAAESSKLTHISEPDWFGGVRLAIDKVPGWFAGSGHLPGIGTAAAELRWLRSVYSPDPRRVGSMKPGGQPGAKYQKSAHIPAERSKGQAP